MMDLDELRSVQSRERQTDSLQQLRETFYQDVGEFIESLRDERERAAERADDPWNSPEVGRLSDDIETAEQTVEAIYERRVGKIVKMASLAAADMPTEDDGLTSEEERLFDALVSQIENNRSHVEAVLDGDSPPPSNAAVGSSKADGPTETAAPPGEGDADASADSKAGIDAADLMGSGPDEKEPPSPSPQGDSGQADDETPTPPSRDPQSGERPEDPSSRAQQNERSAPASESTERESHPEGSTGDRSPEASSESESRDGDSERSPRSVGEDTGAENRDVPPEKAPTQTTDGGTAVSTSDTDEKSAPTGATSKQTETERGATDTESTTVERTTVRITDDVGEIFGVDQRSYDLSSEDVVTLPEQNATPLVDSDAAERLE